MSPLAVEVQGTLQPDGTLVLDKKPELPPGRVRVVVELVFDPKPDIVRVLEKIWAEREAHGLAPRSKEEIDAELAATREEDEERLLEFERLHDEGNRRRGFSPPPDAP